MRCLVVGEQHLLPHVRVRLENGLDEPATEPFAGLAFKIATDPFVGKLAYFRVYSGKVTGGSYILNSSTGEKERVLVFIEIQWLNAKTVTREHQPRTHGVDPG